MWPFRLAARPSQIHWRRPRLLFGRSAITPVLAMACPLLCARLCGFPCCADAFCASHTGSFEGHADMTIPGLRLSDGTATRGRPCGLCILRPCTALNRHRFDGCHTEYAGKAVTQPALQVRQSWRGDGGLALPLGERSAFSHAACVVSCCICSGEAAAAWMRAESVGRA